MSGGVIVGVDVGGTFTDVFAIDRASGRATITKVPTTPDNQADGFARGGKIVVLTLEIGPIGKHRQAGGTAIFIGARQAGRVEIGADQALTRRGFL